MKYKTFFGRPLPKKQVLDALEAAFIADNVKFIRIDGKTAPARRHQLVESFQVCALSVTARVF